MQLYIVGLVVLLVTSVGVVVLLVTSVGVVVLLVTSAPTKAKRSKVDKNDFWFNFETETIVFDMEELRGRMT